MFIKLLVVLLVVIVPVTLGNISVSDEEVDSDESKCSYYDHYAQYQLCGPNGLQGSTIYDAIVEYNNHVTNSTEFATKISEFCDTLNNATKCIMEITSDINSACSHDKRVQYFANYIRILARIGNDLCSHTVIYEIAADKGFAHWDLTKFENCAERNSSLPPVRPLFSISYLQDNNICQMIRLVENCGNEMFNESPHDGNIKKYADLAINGLTQDFSCIRER